MPRRHFADINLSMNVKPETTKQGVSLARRSRPQRIADAIKQLIVQDKLKSGDRLPSESELIARFAMAKSTIREATRILEGQGLIESKTGPGGGVFVKQVSNERARALLGNYFYFHNLKVGDIYQLRKLLEPELAASLAGRISAAQIDRLADNLASHHAEPKTPEQEKDHHIHSLKFHALLASFAQNALLGFLVEFMVDILSDITVDRRLFEPANRELWRKGRRYQSMLIEALKSGDSAIARAIMLEHMQTAERLMKIQEQAVLSAYLLGRNGA